MRQLLIVLYCIAGSMFLHGQGYYSLAQYSLDSNAHQIHVVLPGITLNTQHGPSSLHSWLQSSRDRLEIDLSSVPKIEETFSMHTWAQFQTLGVRYNSGHWTFGIDHKQHIESHAFLAPNIFDLLRLGNTSSLGIPQDISMDLEIYNYQSYNLSASYKGNDWVVFGSLGYLVGRSSIFARSNDLALETAPLAEEVNLSGRFALLTNSIENLSSLQNLSLQFPGFERPYFNTDNPGFSVSLGLEKQMNDRWNYRFFVQDLGYILWREDMRLYTREGSEQFQGFDLKEILIQEQEVSVVDSLKGLLALSEDTTQQWRPIASSIHYLLRYKQNDQLSFYGHSFLKLGYEDLIFRIGAGAEYAFSHRLVANVGYSFDASFPFVVDIGFRYEHPRISIYGGVTNPFFISQGLLARQLSFNLQSCLHF